MFHFRYRVVYLDGIHVGYVDAMERDSNGGMLYYWHAFGESPFANCTLGCW